MNLSEVAGRYHFCREDVFVVGKCVLGCGSCTSILLSIGLDFGEWGASLAGFVVSFAFLLKPIMPRTMKEKRARQKERARQEDASNKEGQEELKKAFEAGESLG